eukprot:CAMPEP_0168552868 /NCGR_PEP_ID=MMETSP0413-20121227/6948_1 /TAXON_ID=136452 /ORGANISM="Filamoeba nolandi, Strain NC-AS-23-1" /LENGTH=633 /DNA_ID=CAMNT_0008583515 /DNA_START=2391 /DNA_END=4292 /DNA_ORIENTATION=+
MYMILIMYAINNLQDQSWGTRDTSTDNTQNSQSSFSTGVALTVPLKERFHVSQAQWPTLEECVQQANLPISDDNKIEHKDFNVETTNDNDKKSQWDLSKKYGKRVLFITPQDPNGSFCSVPFKTPNPSGYFKAVKPSTPVRIGIIHFSSQDSTQKNESQDSTEKLCDKLLGQLPEHFRNTAKKETMEKTEKDLLEKAKKEAAEEISIFGKDGNEKSIIYQEFKDRQKHLKQEATEKAEFSAKNEVKVLHIQQLLEDSERKFNTQNPQPDTNNNNNTTASSKEKDVQESENKFKDQNPQSDKNNTTASKEKDEFIQWCFEEVISSYSNIVIILSEGCLNSLTDQKQAEEKKAKIREEQLYFRFAMNCALFYEKPVVVVKDPSFKDEEIAIHSSLSGHPIITNAVKYHPNCFSKAEKILQDMEKKMQSKSQLQHLEIKIWKYTFKIPKFWSKSVAPLDPPAGKYTNLFTEDETFGSLPIFVAKVGGQFQYLKPCFHEYFRQAVIKPSYSNQNFEKEIKESLMSLRSSIGFLITLISISWLVIVLILSNHKELQTQGLNSLGLAVVIVFGFLTVLQFFAMVLTRSGTLLRKFSLIKIRCNQCTRSGSCAFPCCLPDEEKVPLNAGQPVDKTKNQSC